MVAAPTVEMSKRSGFIYIDLDDEEKWTFNRFSAHEFGKVGKTVNKAIKFLKKYPGNKRVLTLHYGRKHHDKCRSINRTLRGRLPNNDSLFGNLPLFISRKIEYLNSIRFFDQKFIMNIEYLSGIR